MQGVALLDFLAFYEANVTDKEMSKKLKRYFKLNTTCENKINLKELEAIYVIFNPLKARLKREDKFYLGYEIPQLNQEIDLLLFRTNGTQKIVYNIEIKSKNVGVERQIKQLKSIKYYLKGSAFSTYKQISYTFVLDENTFYDINGMIVSNEDIYDLLLTSTANLEIGNLNDYFNPAKYLVSPFNDVERFEAEVYILTEAQQDFANKILANSNSFSISGAAGTGKTLLLYNCFKKEENACLIHCGVLNEGHNKLIDLGYNIYSIKEINIINLDKYNIIYIDEYQRIRPNSLNSLTEKIKNQKFVIAYDELQTFELSEIPISDKLDKLSSNIEECNLTEKIRSNKEIATFVKKFYAFKKYKDKKLIGTNISISIHDDVNELKTFYKMKVKQENYTYISHTPSNYGALTKRDMLKNDLSSHKALGQEFDNVIVIIDECLRVEKNVIFKSPYEYSGLDYSKTLFQQLTRARNKLHICVIDNKSAYDHCMDILLD